MSRLTDEELAHAEAMIAKRGECAGPLTTFEDGLSKVGILCRDNWDDVIRWLAECERVFPAALAELRERRAADLTDEEREALATARAIVNGFVRTKGNGSERALAVLDKLLARKP